MVADGSPIRPVYLFAGGRSGGRKKQVNLITRMFAELGITSPKVAYCGAASGEDGNFFRFVSSELTAAGAGSVAHAVIARKGADLERAKSILEESDAVFMSGGDVEAGMEGLRAKDMIGFLATLHRGGKPFFGISAGAIMLAKMWVRWRDPDDDTTAELFPCLGFAPVICDTHDEDGGWEELRVALRLGGQGSYGYGLATGSGVRVFPDGRLEIMGGEVYEFVNRQGEVVFLGVKGIS
ncbi:MAG: Type 1 glutamine amidotransferase-like domain-containing protein [Dehalococcoidales bacterium]|nr:Type 1 glutamine amidotransferase-like domain-containing protein [Dehalococcoidales bacterium]